MRILTTVLIVMCAVGCVSQHMILQRPTGEIVHCVGKRSDSFWSAFTMNESPYRQCTQAARDAGYDVEVISDFDQCIDAAKAQGENTNAEPVRKRCLREVADGQHRPHP